MRRVATRWIPAGLIFVVVVVAGVIFNPFALLQGDEPDAGRAPRATTEVAVSDLVATFEAEDGTIGFVDQRTVSGVQAGTVGWIAAPSSEIEIGQPLYERDFQPVVFLAGETPAWRTMTVGDVGPDVAQLEQNLEQLGYGDATEFTIDDTYTSITEAIVSRWQSDLGVDETGTVALGDVVFGAPASRVGEVHASVGDSTAATEILTLSSDSRELTFNVTAETVGSVSPGLVVSARLPDRSTVTATVQSVAPAGAGISIVTAELVDGVESLPRGENIPVTVSWDATSVSDAVTVPASALIRLDSGGYGLEVSGENGSTELVPVVPGISEGSLVQILEGVEPGTRIVAP